jgi:lipopolysaccharide export system permease protein
MSISALHAYVNHLEENRQDAERYRIALWGKLAYPVAAPAMLLAGPGLRLSPPTGGRRRRAAADRASSSAWDSTFSTALAAQVAQLQGWPAPAAALTPILTFSLAAIVALVVGGAALKGDRRVGSRIDH